MHTLITNQMRNSQSNASQTSQDFFFLKNRPDSYSSGQIQLQANDKTYDLKIVQLIWQDEYSTMFVMDDVTGKINYYRQIEEISHYKDLLLATVTHDLKTPLIAVISYNKMV